MSRQVHHSSAQERGVEAVASPTSASMREGGHPHCSHVGDGQGAPPLRVLHIGNIANNAYKNVKLLNQAGLDCDVICYDYYHLMGAPEWEDADFEGTVNDQFYPNWIALDLHGFRRPRWFAQGPLQTCLQYLLARRRGQTVRAWIWWRLLGGQRWWLCAIWKPARSSSVFMRVAPWIRRRRLQLGSVRTQFSALVCAIRRVGKRSPWLVKVVKAIKSRLRAVDSPPEFRESITAPSLSPSPQPVTVAIDEFHACALALVEQFSRLFPERADRLTIEELEGWRPLWGLWRELFTHYDLIQGYATDPIWPLLCGKRPYLAFEHGTIRDIPFQPTLQGRITAIGYALADGVFITNGDCLASVPKLHIQHPAPMLHPVDEREYEALLRDPVDWHQQFGAKYLFLCTLRHDWAIKGTDVYLRALPQLSQLLGRNFKLLLTRWGAQLAESEALIRELGVEDLVVWLDPIPRRRLIRLQKAIDVVFDQVALPHFGATAPEAIAAGVPVLMSYDPTSTEWIVAEPAPILSVRTAGDVVSQVQRALDPQWRADYVQRAREWAHTQHSYRRVVDGHMQMYQHCLQRHR